MSKENKQLQDTLMKERLRSEQHHLNYDKLKALTIRLQLEHLQGINNLKESQSHSSTPLPPIPIKDFPPTTTIPLPNTHTTMTIREFKLEQNCGGGIHEDEITTTTTTTPCVQEVPVSNPNSNDDNKITIRQKRKKELLKNEIDVGKLNEKNRVETQVDFAQEIQYWKKQYIKVLNEYQAFKAQSDFIFESNINAAEQKVLVLLEETEKTCQTLEKEKFSLTSTCRDLNREKIALECEIRTLHDELEETRRKLQCLEEKVTKECDFHHPKKIDESNFNASELTKCYCGLQSSLLAVERKNQYLEHEIEEVNLRNDQLTEEIKAIFSSHNTQVKDLKNLMNVYETQLQEERIQFEIKLAESHDIMDGQEKYMKEIDSYLKEKEETETSAVEHINNYAAKLLDESNKTLMLLEQKLKKSQIHRKDLNTSLSKAVQVIQKLKEQPKLCHNAVLDSCAKICTTFSITYENLNSYIIKPFNLKEREGLFSNKGLFPKSYDDETEIDTILESIQKLLKELMYSLEFWKKENDAHMDQLKIRTCQLEQNMNTDKKKLFRELNSSREKCQKYRRWIKHIRRKFTTFQLKRDIKRKNVSFVDTPNYKRAFTKEVKQRPHSSPKYVLHSKDIAQLQKKHAKFSEILEHVDKYVTEEAEYSYKL